MASLTEWVNKVTPFLCENFGVKFVYATVLVCLYAEGFEQDPEFVVQWVTTLLFNAGFCLPTYATTQMVKITLTHLQGQTKRGNILDIFNTTAEDLDTENKFPHSIVTPPDNCVQCGTKLTFERSRARFKTAYMYSFSSGPKILRSYSKSCESCNTSVYSAYFCVKSGNRGRQSSIRHLSPYPKPFDLFVSTQCTYFDAQLMLSVEADITAGIFTFGGKATSYNHLWAQTLRGEGRFLFLAHLKGEGRWLNAERLEDAFFKWTLINFLRAEGKPVENVELGAGGADLDEILLAYFPYYEKAFEKEFAKHLCETPGCTNCLVIDGHLKCRRYICSTRNVNFKALDGFPNGGFFEGCHHQPVSLNTYIPQ